MSGWVAITLIVVLLALNAFFVGAEFSLLSSRRDRLEAMLEQGTTRARVVLDAGKNASLMLAGAQLGITICSLALGRLGEPAVAVMIERALGPLAIPAFLLHTIAFIIALSLVGLAHLLIGEMVPKNLAIATPERLALWLVPPHVLFVRLTKPLISLFNVAANGVLRLAKVEPKDELGSAYTSDELALLITESRKEGLLDDSEHRRLAKTLSSAERTVAEVLVPTGELTTLPRNPTVGDVERVVSTTGFSRFPILDDEGGLAGYLHVKDVLDQAGADPSTPVAASRVRGLPVVSAEDRLDDALTTLRRAQSHLARAVDKDGRLLGVVALEDLLEEYVGTVRDAMHVGAH